MYHSDVHHFQLDAAGPSQAVDGCAAMQEIQHHVRGHLLRVGADAFGTDAVIAGKQHQARLRHREREALEDTGTAVGNLFQSSEAAGRLGQLQLPHLGLLDPAGIHGRNLL